MDCIFCKIINKEAPAEYIYEDDNFIVIKDINPSAPIHYLIIPRKHIDSVAHLKKEDKELMGEMILTAQKVGKNLKSYRLRINTGRGAGQIVDHIHMHLFSK
jgi:histidine triad (HIT) family protein